MNQIDVKCHFILTSRKHFFHESSSKNVFPCRVFDKTPVINTERASAASRRDDVDVDIEFQLTGGDVFEFQNLR